jgi:hypothetical protein
LLAEAGGSPVDRMVVRADRPITTILTDPRAALRLVVDELATGLYVARWDLLTGLVEEVYARLPPPPGAPAEMTARTGRAPRGSEHYVRDEAADPGDGGRRYRGPGIGGVVDGGELVDEPD